MTRTRSVAVALTAMLAALATANCASDVVDQVSGASASSGASSNSSASASVSSSSGVIEDAGSDAASPMTGCPLVCFDPDLADACTLPKDPCLSDGPGSAVCDEDAQCSPGLCSACEFAEDGYDGQTGYCHTPCMIDDDCSNGGSCLADGHCGAPKPCATAADCAPNHDCAGVCTRRPCKKDSDCDGYCVPLDCQRLSSESPAMTCEDHGYCSASQGVCEGYS